MYIYSLYAVHMFNSIYINKNIYCSAILPNPGHTLGCVPGHTLKGRIRPRTDPAQKLRPSMMDPEMSPCGNPASARGG